MNLAPWSVCLSSISTSRSSCINNLGILWPVQLFGSWADRFWESEDDSPLGFMALEFGSYEASLVLVPVDFICSCVSFFSLSIEFPWQANGFLLLASVSFSLMNCPGEIEIDYSRIGVGREARLLLTTFTAWQLQKAIGNFSMKPIDQLPPLMAQTF